MPEAPEQLARQNIDQMLRASGWAVQDYKAFDPSASVGVALREVPLMSGRCDYLLLVNRRPVGVGVCESDKTESRLQEKKSIEKLESILLASDLGKSGEKTLTILAERLDDKPLRRFQVFRNRIRL